ncbi:uncharacterized protein LOC143196358 [Rhynchophorus ferrugineus]|uniref:uncharacterized protein LOC143196358 n=1 Tax=Rhynchophorus ferrugineus TaxID=354439 RepID=UPI003FCC2BAD
MYSGYIDPLVISLDPQISIWPFGERRQFLRGIDFHRAKVDTLVLRRKRPPQQCCTAKCRQSDSKSEDKSLRLIFEIIEYRNIKLKVKWADRIPHLRFPESPLRSQRSRKVCNHFKNEDYRPTCGKPWLKQDVIRTCNLNNSLPLLQNKANIPPMAILQSHRVFVGIEVEPSTSDRYVGDFSNPADLEIIHK